ncbi:DUF1266 domain-containing protein [Pseudomonas sp. F1_0610]|uniref:DUF1266 domain-containing protein n=1 Tax=Pseudomonas sp. F1_0610 TaxID=3114284 RepID=UPI0039C2D388
MNFTYLIILLISGVLAIKVIQAIWRTLYRIRLNHQLIEKNRIELAHFNQQHPCPTLTEWQKQGLALAAPYFLHDGEPIATLTASNQSAYYSLSSLRYLLDKEWEIFNSNSARTVIEHKLSLVDSFQLDQKMQDDPIQKQQALKAIAEKTDNQLQIEQPEQLRSTYAWDVCLAVGLARRCYWASYISQQDLWHCLTKALAITASKSSSWLEYALSIHLGYVFADVEEPYLLNEIYLLLISYDDSNCTTLTEAQAWQDIPFPTLAD